MLFKSATSKCVLMVAFADCYSRQIIWLNLYQGSASNGWVLNNLLPPSRSHSSIFNQHDVLGNKESHHAVIGFLPLWELEFCCTWLKLSSHRWKPASRTINYSLYLKCHAPVFTSTWKQLPYCQSSPVRTAFWLLPCNRWFGKHRQTRLSSLFHKWVLCTT